MQFIYKTICYLTKSIKKGAHNGFRRTERKGFNKSR